MGIQSSCLLRGHRGWRVTVTQSPSTSCGTSSRSHMAPARRWFWRMTLSARCRMGRFASGDKDSGGRDRSRRPGVMHSVSRYFWLACAMPALPVRHQGPCTPVRPREVLQMTGFSTRILFDAWLQLSGAVRRVPAHGERHGRITQPCSEGRTPSRMTPVSFGVSFALSSPIIDRIHGCWSSARVWSWRVFGCTDAIAPTAMGGCAVKTQQKQEMQVSRKWDSHVQKKQELYEMVLWAGGVVMMVFLLTGRRHS